MLIEVYKEYKAKVEKELANDQWLNVIFNVSENINGQRVLNICVQVAGRQTFYWTTIDTKAVELTAVNYLLLLQPILRDITAGNLACINSFSTDSCNTMRATRQLCLQHPKLQHCFWALCDSHGLQLLIKDLLALPDFTFVFQNTSILTTFFSNSKLQNARLRQEQERLGKPRHAIVAR